MGILLMCVGLFNFFQELAMKSVLSLLAISALVLLAACNTVKGVGQDVQKVGTTIEDAAKKK
jgi:predicted small secreted protein